MPYLPVPILKAKYIARDRSACLDCQKVNLCIPNVGQMACRRKKKPQRNRSSKRNFLKSIEIDQARKISKIGLMSS